MDLPVLPRQSFRRRDFSFAKQLVGRYFSDTTLDGATRAKKNLEEGPPSDMRRRILQFNDDLKKRQEKIQEKKKQHELERATMEEKSWAAVVVQRIYRGFKCRREFESLRRNAAAFRIQCGFREFLKKREDSFERLAAAMCIQALVRGVQCRNLLRRQEKSSLLLQRTLCGWRHKRRYFRLLRGFRRLQAVYRGGVVRKQYRILVTRWREARNSQEEQKKGRELRKRRIKACRMIQRWIRPLIADSLKWSTRLQDIPCSVHSDSSDEEYSVPRRKTCSSSSRLPPKFADDQPDSAWGRTSTSSARSMGSANRDAKKRLLRVQRMQRKLEKQRRAALRREMEQQKLAVSMASEAAEKRRLRKIRMAAEQKKKEEVLQKKIQEEEEARRRILEQQRAEAAQIQREQESIREKKRLSKFIDHMKERKRLDEENRRKQERMSQQMEEARIRMLEREQEKRLDAARRHAEELEKTKAIERAQQQERDRERQLREVEMLRERKQLEIAEKERRELRIQHLRAKREQQRLEEEREMRKKAELKRQRLAETQKRVAKLTEERLEQRKAEHELEKREEEERRRKKEEQQKAIAERAARAAALAAATGRKRVKENLKRKRKKKKVVVRRELRPSNTYAGRLPRPEAEKGEKEGPVASRVSGSSLPEWNAALPRTEVSSYFLPLPTDNPALRLTPIQLLGDPEEVNSRFSESPRAGLPSPKPINLVREVVDSPLPSFHGWADVQDQSALPTPTLWEGLKSSPVKAAEEEEVSEDSSSEDDVDDPSNWLVESLLRQQRQQSPIGVPEEDDFETFSGDDEGHVLDLLEEGK